MKRALKHRKEKLTKFADVSTGIVLTRIEENIGDVYNVFQHSQEGCSNYEIRSSKKISENYFLEEGDIIFKGLYPCQAILLPEECIGNLLSSNYGRIRVKEEYKHLITSEFLTCFLNSKVADKIYSKLVAGSVIQKISMQNLREIEVPIPEIEEQKKIATLNANLKEKISELQKLVELSKELQNFYMNELLK